MQTGSQEIKYMENGHKLIKGQQTVGGYAYCDKCGSVENTNEFAELCKGSGTGKEVAKLQAELEELRRFEELAMRSSACKDCGTSIVSYCLGCKIKTQSAEIEKLVELCDQQTGAMESQAAEIKRLKEYENMILRINGSNFDNPRFIEWLKGLFKEQALKGGE